VVLSNPQITGGRILVVNLSTLREGCVDDICILGREDYDLLTHPTTVAYSRHEMGSAAGLELAVRHGLFTIITPVPTVTLAKILDGARRSRELPKAAKDLLSSSS
jgi:hypothetical protein